MSPPNGSVTSAPSRLVRRSDPVNSCVAGLIATPGTTRHASWKRRLVVTGTEVSAWLLMLTDNPARSGSTIGDSPITVTVSATEPTAMVNVTSVTAFSRTITFWTTVCKDESSTRTTLDAGGGTEERTA